jgi:hypothetical protein
MGQVKLKQKLAEASKHRTEKKPRAKGKLSKLRKFIFGSHRGGDCGEGSDVCPTGEGCRAAYPTLGQFKRYASGSYDVKYGDIFGRPQPSWVAFGMMGVLRVRVQGVVSHVTGIYSCP